MWMRGWFLGVLAVAILAALSFSRGAEASVFDCDETGVQLAVATGGGPHTFSCAGPTTITLTSATLDVSASVILDGEGLLTLSGGDAFQVFSVQGGATLELRNLAITEGNGNSGSGGCILVSPGGSLIVAWSSVTDCHLAPGGAGGAILSNGSVTVTDSTIAGNTAGFGGGGIYSGSTSAAASLSVSGSDIVGNSSGIGGGIVIQMGGLTLVDTSVSGNTAEVAGGIAALGGPNVGALVISGTTISGNTSTNLSVPSGGIRSGATSLTLRNSTLTGNTGGAISNFGGMLIENTTISGNTAAAATAIVASGTETLRNSVIDGTCVLSFVRTSQGGNVESPGDTCNLVHATDQVNVSAAALHLGALGDHGGPTPTVPLLHPSAAIGAAVGCPPPATDQRGVARPQAAACDSGAYESEVAVPIAGLAWLAIALAGAGVAALRRRPPPLVHTG